MSDTDKVSLTPEEIEVIKKDLTAEIETTYKAKIDKLQSVIDEKVEGKKQLEEQARLDAEAAKKYDDALKIRNEQAQALEKERDDLKAKFEATEGKAKSWDEYQTQRRTALVEKLPEDKRDAYKDVSLSVLETTVELIGTTVATHKGVTKHPANGNDQKWKAMSAEERRALMSENPTLAREKQREYVMEK